MSLEAGQRLGPYEIVGPLGAGGMGEVYRARDGRLDRDVAIKVLPAHLADDESARQRLEREARAVSGLSHPNICTLYDVGHEGDTFYLVIEYLEGETLAQRLERGGLPTDEVLRRAIEIADALDKAHRRGVVHRDLKPGNVMLTAGGAKLLDFGLAKSVEVAGGGTSSLSVAPTMTSPLTAEGTIVGTFQYMAPEQLEGREADARSDIFAFGSMLFEMITGRRAFEGKTQAGLIAAIIEREPPDVSTLQPLAPPALDRLIRTCLVKNPEERRQSMHDVLLDLRWIAEAGSQAGVPAPVTRRRRSRLFAAWAVAAVLAVTSLALGVVLVSRRVEPPRRVVAQLVPPDGVSYTRWGTAFSPDGGTLAFVGRRDDGSTALFLREIGTGATRQVQGTDDPYYPFWSPDGRSLGYFSNDALQRIDAQGGTPLTIASATNGFGGSWNRDDVIIFTPRGREGIHRVAANGGDAERLTEPAGGHYMPQFLPDGRHFVYIESARSRQERFARLSSLDGTFDVQLVQTENRVQVVGDTLLFIQGDALIAQTLDLGARALTGRRRVIAEPVATFAAAPDGTLAYLPRREASGVELVSYDGAGRSRTALATSDGLDDLAISADGSRLAMMRRDPSNRQTYDVWTFELDRKLFSRVTFHDGSDDPVWSPDGRQLIYAVEDALYRVNSSGAGEPELVLQTEQDPVPSDWTRDGSRVVFSWLAEGGQLDLMALPVEGGEPEALLASPYDEFQAQVSPDGRWLAYTSDESGELQVYVRSWPDLGRKWQISTVPSGMPRWRGDGRELYVVTTDRELQAVAVHAEGDELSIGATRDLFRTRIDSAASRSTDYVVAPDGSAFYFIEIPEGAGQERPSLTLMVGALDDGS